VCKQLQQYYQFDNMATNTDNSTVNKSKPALHCCVPLCTSDSRYNPELHFHHIPKNHELKRQWIIKIRRDEGPLFNVQCRYFSLSIFLQFSDEINCFSNQIKPKVIDLSLFSFSQNLP
jgi:hypothetical protein